MSGWLALDRRPPPESNSQLDANGHQHPPNGPSHQPALPGEQGGASCVGMLLDGPYASRSCRILKDG